LLIQQKQKRSTCWYKDPWFWGVFTIKPETMTLIYETQLLNRIRRFEVFPRTIWIINSATWLQQKGVRPRRPLWWYR
jgi:hypothetical protein